MRAAPRTRPWLLGPFSPAAGEGAEAPTWLAVAHAASVACLPADSCRPGVERGRSAWGTVAPGTFSPALISAPTEKPLEPGDAQTLAVTAAGSVSVQPLGSASVCTQGCQNIPAL